MTEPYLHTVAQSTRITLRCSLMNQLSYKHVITLPTYRGSYPYDKDNTIVYYNTDNPANPESKWYFILLSQCTMMKCMCDTPTRSLLITAKSCDIIVMFHLASHDSRPNIAKQCLHCAANYSQDIGS